MITLRHHADIYWIQLKTQLAVQFQYRIAMFIWMIGMVLEPVMYLIVWTTVARARGGSVGSYDAPEFAAYYIIMMAVNHATFSWIMWEYEYYVREGTLSGLLLRPIHPIHRDIADNLAYKVLTGTVLIPIATALWFIFGARAATSLTDVLLFVPALALAAVLRILMEWTLAMAAFWVTRVAAINQLYMVVAYFFSGWIAPLELFPSIIRRISYLLPFRWTINFPIELLLGRLSGQEIAIGLLAQLCWIGVVLVVLNGVWQRGVRRFSAVGA